MGKECRKRWKSPLIILILLFLFSFSMSGCGNPSKSDEPVVLTLWHVYGAQVDSPLNKIIDRFATETGADEKELSTWEGIFNMAKKYTQWTDEKTPEIKNDGKSFFVHDYHFNYFQVGCESLGEAFFSENEKGGRLDFGPKFKKAFIPYSDAAISGGIWLREGYATEPLRTGEAIAKTQKEYRFYTAPKLANYLDLEVRFEKNIRLELSRAKQEYEAVADRLAKDNKLTKTSKKIEKERIMEDAFKNLKKIMN